MILGEGGQDGVDLIALSDPDPVLRGETLLVVGEIGHQRLTDSGRVVVVVGEQALIDSLEDITLNGRVIDRVGE